MRTLKSGKSAAVVEHNIEVLQSMGYSERAATNAAIRLANTPKPIRPKTSSLVHENPLSGNSMLLIGVGIVAAIGIGAYLLTGSAKSPSPQYITVAPGTTQTITSPGGLYVELPTGATSWANASGVTSDSTTPLYFASTGANVVYWLDAQDATQSMTINLNVG